MVVRRFAGFTMLLALIGLGVIFVGFGGSATAVESSEEEVQVRDESACRTARTVGRTLTSFTLGLANGNAARVERMFGPDTILVYVAGPAAIIPRLPGVQPTQEERGEPRTWRYRSFKARDAESLSEFVSGIKRIPFRLRQISISPSMTPNLPPGTPPSSAESKQKEVHFTVSGRGTGRPWTRELQVYGKGGINCDGTIALVAIHFRGGNTGHPLNPGVCRGDANLAVTSGARVCSRSRAAYRFWNRREAK